MKSRELHKFKTEEEFKLSMDHLPLMIRACNKDGKALFLNAVSTEYAGDGHLWLSKIHPDFIYEYTRLFASHSALKTAFKIKYKFLAAGGNYRWLTELAEPWHSPEGSFLGFVCYTQDIDELIGGDASIEAKSNLEQILNMLPASVVVIRGYDLVVEMINKSNLAYWNKTKEQVLGRPFLEILPDLADQPFAGQLRRVMDTGEILDVKESPVLFTAEDGSTRETYVDYTYQPLSDLDGKRNGVLVMSFEITDRVLSRRLLEKYAQELALANADLANSEARFKYLIQEAPVAIGVLQGREMIIESANGKILEVWGKSREIVGMPLSIALPELEGQPFLGILDQVFTTGEPFYANEIRALLEHDGEMKELFFNVTYQPIADETGLTADILVVAVDVTKQVNSRRLVEQSEQHFRYLADLVPAKISNAHPSGEVTFFNKQWLDFAGMGFEDLRDFGYHQMMHPEEIPAFQLGLAQAAATGVPHISEMRFKNTAGKYIWHLNTASPVKNEDGQISMWVGSTTDIQALKNEEQRKGDFVSMLSHELKTPVTSVKGHVQLLLRVLDRETVTPLTSRLRPSLSRIDQLLVQLTGLINDMLDLTRIDAGRLDLKKEPLMLDALAIEVIEDFRLSHQQHYFHLNSESNVEVMADKHKISQVLINLIANAVKYAPDSNVVDISITSTANEAFISIRDYGIGIDEKDQQKIFERFYRVEGQNEVHYTGFGIGLYLANSIMDFHGGRISLDSIKGKGSTFTAHFLR
jgi:PAS domain S-box-containing protein